MNQKIKNHLTSYCVANGLEVSDVLLEQLLFSAKPIQTNQKSDVWGTEVVFNVVEIKGLLIGFDVCYNRIAGISTIDLFSVCEVVGENQMIVVYKPKVELTNIAVICKDTKDFIGYVRRVTGLDVLRGVLANCVRQFEHKGTMFFKICCLEDTNGQSYHNWVKQNMWKRTNMTISTLLIIFISIANELKQ